MEQPFIFLPLKCEKTPKTRSFLQVHLFYSPILEGLNKKDAFEFYPPTILSSKIPSKSHQF